MSGYENSYNQSEAQGGPPEADLKVDNQYIKEGKGDSRTAQPNPNSLYESGKGNMGKGTGQEPWSERSGHTAPTEIPTTQSSGKGNGEQNINEQPSRASPLPSEHYTDPSKPTRVRDEGTVEPPTKQCNSPSPTGKAESVTSDKSWSKPPNVASSKFKARTLYPGRPSYFTSISSSVKSNTSERTASADSTLKIHLKKNPRILHSGTKYEPKREVPHPEESPFFSPYEVDLDAMNEPTEVATAPTEVYETQVPEQVTVATEVATEEPTEEVLTPTVPMTNTSPMGQEPQQVVMSPVSSDQWAAADGFLRTIGFITTPKPAIVPETPPTPVEPTPKAIVPETTPKVKVQETVPPNVVPTVAEWIELDSNKGTSIAEEGEWPPEP